MMSSNDAPDVISLVNVFQMTNYEYVVQVDTNGIPINSIGRDSTDSMSKICADRFAIDGMRKE